MIDSFLQYLQYEKNYSSHTVLSYQNDLKQFKSFCINKEGIFEPQTVKSSSVRQWVLSMMENSINPKSVHRKLSALKSFYRYLNQKGISKNNPTTKIISPKAKKNLPYFFKEKEMDEILIAHDNETDFEPMRDNLIIDLFYQTGIRLSELINLKDTDIDHNLQVISVIGKRNKERHIPIGKTLLQKIERYIETRNNTTHNKNSFFFVKKNGEPLYPKKIYLIIKENMQTVSSLSKCSPHVLRHTFATTMLNHNADLNAVKTAMGHANLTATEIYTHTTFEQLQNIYNHSHPREIKK